VFVICSERENFPTTCLEAQCCGTPVCGFDVGGVRETLVDNCDLCSYGEVACLLMQINCALDRTIDVDKAIRSKSAIELFGNKHMCDTYQVLYGQVIK